MTRAAPIPVKEARVALQRALRTMADSLEAAALLDARMLSRMHPGKDVVFVSAMGVFTWFVDHREMRPPAATVFANALRDFGWAAIPSPVNLEVRDDRLVRRRTSW